MITLQGNPASRGVAIGTALVYEPFQPAPWAEHISAGQADTELQAYHRACEAAAGELEQIIGQMTQAGDTKGAIFQAQRDLLDDEVIREEIETAIQSELLPAAGCVEKVYQAYAALLARTEDDRIRERAADLSDVRIRLLRCLEGKPEKNLAHLTQPTVIVARDLLPSDTATLDRCHVLAIVTEIGGATSHSAILARSYEIPALLGVDRATAMVHTGQTVVVDAVEGKLLLEPDSATRQTYQKKREALSREMACAKRYRSAVPQTRDGLRVEVELNIATAGAEELANHAIADGVGLFRTEFLYLGRETLPTEEEQLAAYQKVLAAFSGKPVVLRTMHIGGAKQLECMQLAREENPFLGNRALRLCLARPEVFRTQLRAALRAARDGDLRIMFPMVSGMEDIAAAKAALDEARQSLVRDGLPFRSQVQLGVMVEIPSIALIADLVAREVDFCSIGSNDLCQYMMAADRMNPQVSGYYRPLHPAMLRAIGTIAQEFRRVGKEAALCGELGGDPAGALALIGLGVHRLSMSPSAVPYVKRAICHSTAADLAQLARQAQQLPYEADIRALFTTYLQTHQEEETEEFPC